MTFSLEDLRGQTSGIKNIHRTWYPCPENYPEIDRPVFALLEFDSYHTDEFPSLECLILRDKDDGGARWEIVDAAEDEEPFVSLERFVVAWRYVDGHSKWTHKQDGPTDA